MPKSLENWLWILDTPLDECWIPPVILYFAFNEIEIHNSQIQQNSTAINELLLLSAT